MKRKTISVLIQLSMLATLLSGCGSANPDTAQTEASNETAIESSSVEDISSESTAKSAEPEEAITITYANFNASGGNEATLDSMYQAFHEKNPNINVEIETIAMDDYFTRLQTRIAGGTAPDCFEMNIENFAAYASKGILAELSDADTTGLNQTALSAFTYDGSLE